MEAGARQRRDVEPWDRAPEFLRKGLHDSLRHEADCAGAEVGRG